MADRVMVYFHLCREELDLALFGKEISKYQGVHLAQQSELGYVLNGLSKLDWAKFQRDILTFLS